MTEITRRETQDDIEFPRQDPSSKVPPGTPFKGNRERVAERGQNATLKIVPEDLLQAPVIDAIEPWHANGLDCMKRRLRATQCSVIVGTTNKGTSWSRASAAACE